MATARVTEIADEDAFRQRTSDASPSTLLVIYFHAPWAAPCKQMSEVLKALAQTFPDDDSIEFLSLNAEELPDVSETYDVTAVPYIVLQKGGQIAETISGSDAQKVRVAVERAAGRSGHAGKLDLPPAQSVNQPVQQPAAVKKPSQVDKEAIFKRLDDLTKAAPVMLFMKGTPSAPQCGFSRNTVALLRDRSIRYGFFNILADDDVRQSMKEYADWPTFPQLWVNGELVGGLDIVSHAFRYSAGPSLIFARCERSSKTTLTG